MKFKTFGECFAALGWDRERVLRFHLEHATLSEALEAIARELTRAGFASAGSACGSASTGSASRPACGIGASKEVA